MTANLHAYWKNPNDGLNNPLDYVTCAKAQRRSRALVATVEKLFPDTNISILELGSGTGRNLHYLQKAGYHQLLGVELSPLYIKTMREHFPALASLVVEGPIENILPQLPNKFDLVFSMAVLEHIPPESKSVFPEIVRIAKNLITIEDEQCNSWRHFPRNYRDIFEDLNIEYVKGWKNIPGLSTAFVMRLFKEKYENSAFS